MRAEKQLAQNRAAAVPAAPRKRLARSVLVAFLALMLIAPLTAGLIAVTGSDDPERPELTIDDLPTTTLAAGLVDPGFEGLALSGPTPCPATDGSQERVTSFSEAPPMCLDPDEVVTVSLDTLGGNVELTIDASADPVGANLFVALARYGVYESAPIYSHLGGVVTLGGAGDAGFRVDGAQPPADGRYPVGSVVMLMDFDDQIEGQVVIVTSEAGSAALEAENRDPVIGMVTSGLDAFDAIRDLQAENTSITYRVQRVAVLAGACPAEDGSSPRAIDFARPHPMCIDATQTHVAVFDTSEGEVRVTLDSTNTPRTTNNFVTLARWGYYDGTTLFRTDPSIDIIQGGSPHTESPTDPGPGYNIPDEPVFDEVDGRLVGPYRYEPGQLVMARSAGRDSASAQFFFSTGPNTAMYDGQGIYVVFGQTDDAGLAVLQTIIGLHEPGGQLGGAPSRTVTVNSVTIEVT